MWFFVGNSGLIPPTLYLPRGKDVGTIHIDYMLEVVRNKTGHKELVSHFQLIQCRNRKQCKFWYHIALDIEGSLNSMEKDKLIYRASQNTQSQLLFYMNF